MSNFIQRTRSKGYFVSCLAVVWSTVGCGRGGGVEPEDAGTADAGSPSATDTGAPDAGEPGATDTGAPDAGEPGATDTGTPDAGEPGAADAPTPDGDPGWIVSTRRGPVRGHHRDGLVEFLGIPYAAPPLGDLRWRPPVEHPNWDTPLEANHYGLACPQSGALTGEPLATGEDCLTLNVWTSSLTPSAPRPVMVFIHGGAFRRGASSQTLYDGRNVALAGNVVLVTLDYRLGPLGFLAHPALSAEDAHHSSGNYGLLDQQAALAWVRDNIAGFGGDPTQVTVFGQSAGAMSICAHLVSPLAVGAFRHALLESGPCALLSTPLRAPEGSAAPSAESAGDAFATAIGCGPGGDVLACLRAKSAQELIDTAADAGDLDASRFFPNVDGYVLPQPPLAAMASGQLVPLDAVVAGVTQDEATLFTQRAAITTEAEFEAAVQALAPEHVAEVVQLYPPTGGPYSTAKAAYQAFFTDYLFTCPTRLETRLLAIRGVRAYLYWFTKRTPAGVATGLGVFHGSELPFVFGNFARDSTASAADQVLSAQMMGYWTSFGTAGRPQSTNAPAWPERTATQDAYLDLGSTTQISSGMRAAQCDILERWILGG